MTNEEIQQVSLKIMKDIHDFCVKNNISYSLYGGSAIGAIRHKGFIPWDDDLDIAMPRPDYDRFIKTYRSEKGYKAFARGADGGEKVYIAYCRVCDMNDTYVKAYRMWTEFNTGVWVDVFPLDCVSDNSACCQKQMDYLKRVNHKCDIYKDVHTSLCSTKSFKSFLRHLFLRMTKFYVKDNIDERIDGCQQYEWGSTRHYANLSFTGYGMKEYHSIETLDDYFFVPFEDTKFYLMKGFDEALRDKFGDYMQLPPVENRIAKHVLYKSYWKGKF